MGGWAAGLRRVVLAVVVLVAPGPAMPLSEVVQVPPELEGSPLPGNPAWLDAVDPALGDWVVEAAAVSLPSLPPRGGGVAFAHGVRFDTADHARTAWEAIRAADPEDGRRYDVDGFADVHAHRDPLMAGVALVDYHRLVGTDIYVLQVRVDGPEELSDAARDALAWHVAHTDGGSTLASPAAIVAVLAAIGMVVVGVWSWRRR